MSQPKDYAWMLSYRNNLEGLYSNRRQSAVCDFLINENPKYILEIGCGLNSVVDSFPKDFLVDKTLHVLEPNLALFESAFHRYNTMPNVSVFNIDMESFPSISNNLYDFVIANSVLHEVDNPDSFLKSVKSISKEDTFFWVNVPNLNSVHRKVFSKDAHLNDYQRVDYGRKHYFDAESLESVVGAYGYKKYSFSSSILKPMTDKQLSELILNSDIGKLIFDMWISFKDYSGPYIGAELDFLFKL